MALIDEQYEKVYASAVAYIIPAMERLYGSGGWLNSEEKTRLSNGIKAWTSVVAELRPAGPVDLDREAVEAIVRSYNK